MMVVVAILGILTAIAVPNYRRYQSRARQTEAKIHLSSGFEAEQSFFPTYGTYSSCLGEIGADSAPHGNVSRSSSIVRYYTWGFSKGGDFRTCGPNGNKGCDTFVYNGKDSVQKCDASYWLRNARATDDDSVMNSTRSQSLLAHEVLSSNTFKIPAVGNISTEPILDIWTIDHNKTLVNSQPGL